MVRLHAPEREHVDLIVASVAGGAAASDHDTQPPDLIRRSWARCLNSHRLDPARPGRPVVLTQNELGGFREPMEEFIGIATAELRRLYAQVAGSDYVVILTDANGVAQALRAIADAAFAGGRQAQVFKDGLDRIKVPVQAIWGAEDRIVPAAHATAIPEPHRHVLGGAGHMVHMEKAGEVNRLISDFLTMR